MEQKSRFRIVCDMNRFVYLVGDEYPITETGECYRFIRCVSQGSKSVLIVQIEHNDPFGCVLISIPQNKILS